jgi:uncharacterized membrane protein YhaH (DUF805 family)
MILPLKRYAQFEGRSGRREFLWYSLFLTLCYAVAFAIVVVVIGFELTESSDADSEIFVILAILGAVFLINFVPGLALTTRRLHDMGLPGWLSIVAVVVVFIFSFIGWIAYMIVMSLPPKQGENEYGPPVYDDEVANIFG